MPLSIPGHSSTSITLPTSRYSHSNWHLDLINVMNHCSNNNSDLKIASSGWSHLAETLGMSCVVGDEKFTGKIWGKMWFARVHPCLTLGTCRCLCYEYRGESRVRMIALLQVGIRGTTFSSCSDKAGIWSWSECVLIVCAAWHKVIILALGSFWWLVFPKPKVSSFPFELIALSATVVSFSVNHLCDIHLRYLCWVGFCLVRHEHTVCMSIQYVLNISNIMSLLYCSNV